MASFPAGEPGGKAPNEDDEGPNGSEIVNAQGGPKNVDGDLGVRDGLGGRVFRPGLARRAPSQSGLTRPRQLSPSSKELRRMPATSASSGSRKAS